MRVAGDHLIGCKVIQQIRDEREKLLRLVRIGRGFIVVPGHEQRDRHTAGVIAHDRPTRGVGLDWHRHAQVAQVFLDGERGGFETGGRQDVARVAGIREPRHDGAQALRDAGRRVADAVVVDQQESHDVRIGLPCRSGAASRSYFFFLS